MIRTLLLSLLLLGGLCAGSPAAIYNSVPMATAEVVEPAKDNAASIVRIETTYSDTDVFGKERQFVCRGSGFWTTKGLYTAWHVVEKAETVSVTDYLGLTVEAWGWWRQGEQDVALVRLETPLTVPALVIASEPLKGEVLIEAENIGYWGDGVDLNLPVRCKGFVLPPDTTEVSAKHLGDHFYASNLAVVPGMSGSPLIVNGLVYGVCSHGTMPPSLSFWARLDDVACPAMLGAPYVKKQPAVVLPPFPDSPPGAKKCPPGAKT